VITQSITITHSRSSAEPFFLERRGLAPFSFSFYDWLLIYDWTTYIASRRTYRKHIRCLAMDIGKEHRKHLFLYCIYARCIATEVTRLLPAYSLPRECVYQSLPSNGSTYHSIVLLLYCNTLWVLPSSVGSGVFATVDFPNLQPGGLGTTLHLAPILWPVWYGSPYQELTLPQA
jgi:hypothetical protein